MKKIILVFALIIFFSVLLNGQWVQTNGNFGTEHRVNDLALIDQNLFVGTWGAGIFVSTDDGLNWFERNNGLTSLIVRKIVVHGTKIFAATRKGVFISTDHGNLWTEVNNGLPSTWINGEKFIDIFSIVANDQYIFAGTAGGLYVSYDDGANWIQQQNGLNGMVVALAIKDSILFAGTIWEIHPMQGGHVFLSTNNGLNWNISSNGLPDKIINDFTTTEENIFVAVNDYNGIYRSSDFGENWLPSYSIASSLPNCLTTCNLENINYVFVGNYYPNNEGGIVYLSTNQGGNWISISEGLPSLPNTIVWSLEFNTQYIFAAVNSIVWRRPVEEILEITEVLSEEHQICFNLSQNYPNPFNPSTKIKYSIPTSPFNPSPYQGEGQGERLITLIVFDVLGREVATLVDEYKPAGSYEVEFNAGNATSGVYFYKIHAGDYSSVKKMILLK